MGNETQSDNVKFKLFQELSHYFQSSVPDLKIICGDGVIVMSHKLLLGLTNKCLAEIFTEEDFISDPLTILTIPNTSGESILNLITRLSEEPVEDDILRELFYTNEYYKNKAIQGDLNSGDVNSNLDTKDPCFEAKEEPDPDIKTDCSSEEDSIGDNKPPTKKQPLGEKKPRKKKSVLIVS